MDFFLIVCVRSNGELVSEITALKMHAEFLKDAFETVHI